MNPRDRDIEQREDLLVGLMADYEEALAAGKPTIKIEETAAEFDPQLTAEWDDAKQCLELLDRARRCGTREIGLHSPVSTKASVVNAPQRRLGRFILERELGRGGLGIVYLAHDPQLGRSVAIKIPRFEAILDDDLRHRFLREAEAAARLNHPNLVALHEVGEDGTTCYLASEFCPGPTLAQWLSARTVPVPASEAAAIVLALAEGVRHAHGRGVLHRDIKPSNVLLSANDGGDEHYNLLSPKLTDFGMAKLLEQNGADRTRTGAILGTLAYMAPEQAEGRADKLDCRTDVYALGAILYELLVGAAPYSGQTDVDTLRKMLVSDPVRPRSLRTDVPRDLEAIALKCLAKKQADRYATAHELAADLRRFLTGQPTSARPLSLAARTMKWAQRRPAIAALWFVSVVAIAVIIALNTQRIEDVDEARLIANQESRRADEEYATTRRLLYASRMRKAGQAWRDGNLNLMQNILKDYSEGTPDADLRHFEWFHLNYLANLPHRVLRGHTGEVYGVAYSPDGQKLVTGGEDGAVRVWDMVNRVLLTVLREHSSCVNCVDFAPDGDTFVTASCDKSIKLWSLSQRKVLTTLTGHTQEVDTCTFFDEGRHLISLSRCTTGPREVWVWDVASKSFRTDWLPPGEGNQGIAVAKSGQTLVTFAEDRASVWKRNGDSWALSHRLDNIGTGAVAVLSPDEEYLLISGWPRSLRTCRLRDGALVNELNEHTSSVYGASFPPSGNHLATASCDSSVRVFDFPSGKIKHRFLGHQGRIWQVAWSPASDSLASGGSDGTVRLWDLRQGSSPRHLQIPPDRSLASSITDFAFLQDGKHVNAITNMQNQVWNIETGRSVPLDVIPGEQLRESGTFTPDAHFSKATHPLLPQWDCQAVQVQTQLYRKANEQPTGTVSCSRIVADGSQIIEVGQGRLRTWNLTPLKVLKEQRIDQFNPPPIVFDISPDGRRLCGAHTDGRFEIYNLNDWTTVSLGQIQNVAEAHFSPSGTCVLVRATGVHEYNADTGKQIRDYSQERPAAMSYSADGQRIAITSLLGFVAIYDAVTGEETLRLEGTTGTTVFARDGKSLLANLAPDGGLYFWPGKEETVSR